MQWNSINKKSQNDFLSLSKNLPVTKRLRAEKMRGNSGIIELRATFTMLYNDSLANSRTRTSGSCKQFNTGDTNSLTYFSVSFQNTEKRSIKSHTKQQKSTHKTAIQCTFPKPMLAAANPSSPPFRLLLSFDVANSCPST